MNKLRKKILSWLFGTDVDRYMELLKDNIKATETCIDIRKELVNLNKESIKTLEIEVQVRKSYEEIILLCSDINEQNRLISEYNKVLLAENEKLSKQIKKENNND